jgi:hypothetical protein
MQEKSNLTRLACANVIINGELLRERVLELLKDRYRAVAPEIGIDLALVAQVSKYMDRRDLLYYVVLTSILIIGICCPVVYLWNYGLVLILLFYIPITAIIMFIKNYDEQYRIGSHFTTENFDSEYVHKHLTIPLKEEEQKAVPHSDQNLVVYHDFMPFVGAGIDMGGWSFAIDITRPHEDSNEVKNFSIDELYSDLEKTIQELQFDLQVQDMLFVHGADIRTDKEILPDPFDRPVQSLQANLVEQYKRSSDMRVRHYKWVIVEDWNSELVLSLFLRCSMRGRNLFVEVNRFLLTPLRADISEIDALPIKNWRRIVNLGLKSLFTGPINPFIYSVFLLRRIPKYFDQLLSREGKQRKEVETNVHYNYGATFSVRQLMSSQKFSRYFQKLDHEMYIKIFDKEVLEAIVTFLNEHDIDTSDLKERKTTILNNGILVKGGNIQAESVAAGSGAQAIANRVVATFRGGNKEQDQ